MENFRLTVFRAVAEQASFRKASEHLHLSQPAVSQQVHALEEDLGLRLFDRSGSKVALTAAGKLLFRYAERSARLLAEAREALLRLHGQAGGVLRLGASTTVAQYILPRMLGMFLKQNPRVTLEVKSGNTERIVNLLVDGAVDIGIIEGPALHREVHAELFLKDRMVLIVPRRHELAGMATVSVSALEHVPLLLREQGSGSRRIVEQALKRAGLPPGKLRIGMELDSTEAIVSGVEAGLGVGIVSEWAVGKELRLGTVALVTLDALDLVRDLSLVRCQGPAPEGAAGAFYRFAQAQQKPISNSYAR